MGIETAVLAGYLGTTVLLAGGGAAVASGVNESNKNKKRAEGKAKDQERLQEQIRLEAEAAPGLAAEAAKKKALSRRRTIAKQGKTILSGEKDIVGGQTLLGG